MLTPYRDIGPAARARTLEHEHVLRAAAETACRDGRWRPDDLDEYVLAVARRHGLHVWPSLLRRVRESVGNAPSTA